MFSQDVSQADFEEQVVEASFKQPVVIDFWAPWCAPCKVLKPILEKLADEYGGKFRLAKVNSDENPEISARYAVRGIPSVKAMVDGKVVNEFTGALPESAVRDWLDKIIPSPAEEMRREAQQLAATGDSGRRTATPCGSHRARPERRVGARGCRGTIASPTRCGRCAAAARYAEGPGYPEGCARAATQGAGAARGDEGRRRERSNARRQRSRRTGTIWRRGSSSRTC